MRAVIQRVLKASVTVSDEIISSISNGYCVLIGISRDDTEKDMDFIVRKILNIRLFEDVADETGTSGGGGGGKWNKSIVDRDFEILCVSQFTLQSTLKGNKPDFHLAMSADSSKDFYARFLQQMRNTYKAEKIKDGQFGAYMQVNIQNDGPVTIIIDSKKE